ncbi:NAD(P)/FAD-dependent oxidoreductase [Hyphomonas sp. BRH_c22]|uniref:NAD(P)/FAD-dependent oxidoreductase n=1 Tax=Hyphomonas sp. BRH_c22 TaxID=1629710 RepID=UPI0026086F60|nr:NAD(P)/FAD-dependent oxidoreductase [Hyphomonas sp. BRH_c22]
MTDVDMIVIGAGAIGLACAAELARRGHETYVLESARAIGTGTSSRNSEVIHAGLYYRTGSLRHRLCVSGRRKLYAYLAQHTIPHKRTGKLIVSTDPSQQETLESLFAQGRHNDVEGLRMLSASEARKLEPRLRCDTALLSEETGLIDSHTFMATLRNELEDHGGNVLFDATVLEMRILPDGRFELSVGGREPYTITTRHLINSAGLHAHGLAARMEGYDTSLLPGFKLAKGNYFSCQSRPSFSRLIYPVPVVGGLGIHVTLDLAGQMRFGPDVEWLDHNDPDRVDYHVDPERSESFYEAVRAYWPGLPDGAIVPDYSGCRPKLAGPNEPAADFRIDGPALHGYEGLVHLFGIESPGLTSSLAIADHVADALRTYPV